MSAAATERDPLPADSRYEVVAKIASGGMASVFVGRLRGAAGFWRLVAIKRAHAFLAEDPVFRKMLVGEARLASRIHHPNIVAVQDVEELEHELLLVMDYIEGAALSELETLTAGSGGPLPPDVVVRIALDACAGLHAAHEICDEAGRPLHLVHRDVSPQNILVGLDGVTRIADFGIAKVAPGGSSATTTGALKGKVAYMSPEYIEGEELDARSDVFALGIVVWEALTGQRLFRAGTEIETMRRVVEATVPPPSTVAPGLGTWLDAPVLAALEKSRVRRHRSAREFAEALESAAKGHAPIATHAKVGAEVDRLVGRDLEGRRSLIRDRVTRARAPDGEPIPAGEGEDPGIPITYTDIAAPGRSEVPLPEASTLGSSVSSQRLVRPTAADAARTRRARAAAAGAAALAVVAAGVGILIGRASGPPAAIPVPPPSAAPSPASAGSDQGISPSPAQPPEVPSTSAPAPSAARTSRVQRAGPSRPSGAAPSAAESSKPPAEPSANPSPPLGRPGPNPYGTTK